MDLGNDEIMAYLINGKYICLNYFDSKKENLKVGEILTRGFIAEEGQCVCDQCKEKIF